MENIDFFLNEQQINALKDVEGAVIVSAGAGSGKTRVLTQRIAYILQNNFASPYEILAITFTNKAAKEMKQRVCSISPNGNDVWISTFHSMCAKILRSSISLLGYSSNFTIYDEDDADKVIKQLISDSDDGNKDFMRKQIKLHLSNYKNQNIKLEEYAKVYEYVKDINEITKYMILYENILKKNNALDFDDLIQKTLLLFNSEPEVLSYYANRFKYILVDEFQDTNKVQFELVKMMASVHKNLFVVGDENQCIYSWRGANFSNMFDFEKSFPNVKIYKLEQNYRSTKQILDIANRVIDYNKEQFKKKLWTANENGSEVKFKLFYNEREEAENIAKQIYSGVKNGNKYSDYAILLRLNALTLPFEEKFVEYNIPYRIFGGFKFFDRAEVKQIMYYLKLFVNSKDDIAFKKVINFPKRGIGNTSVEKLEEIASINNSNLIDVMLQGVASNKDDKFYKKFASFSSIYIELLSNYENMSPIDFIKDVIEKFKIKFAYVGDENELDRQLNIDALVKNADTFFIENPDAMLPEYLENISLLSDLDTMDESNNVTVATIHSAKGLEFKNVFICGVEETIFPISRAYDKSSEMEEERRLMYVAITRAEQNLLISACKIRYLYGKNNYMMPSRFIEEAGFGNILESQNNYNSRYTKSYNDDFDRPLPSVKQAYESKFEKIELKTVPIQETNKTSYLKSNTDNETVNDNCKINCSIYSVGQMVFHPKFGLGTILEIENESKFATINFNGFGNKTLYLEVAPLKIVSKK